LLRSVPLAAAPVLQSSDWLRAHLLLQAVQAVAEMDKDPANFTTIQRPDGRQAKGSNMKASHYIVM
jgi:hypothetical protein